MLSILQKSSGRLTTRIVLMMICLAAVALAVPTVRFGAAEATTPGNPMAEGSVGEQAEGRQAIVLLDDKAELMRESGRQKKDGAIEPVDEYFPRPTAAEKKILDALETPVDVAFQGTSLADCFRQVEQQANIDIWIDVVAMRDEGVALDQPITLIAKGRRLESIMKLLMRPQQLEYVIDDDMLKITTTQNAGEKLYTRTYPVGDLCPELVEKSEPAATKKAALDEADPRVRFVQLQGALAPYPLPPPLGNAPNSGEHRGGMGGMGGGQRVSRFSNLINAITVTIQPDSWEELSGPGSIVAVGESSSLVIRQTRSVHQEVLQLLRDLRAAKRLQPAPRRRAADGGDIEFDGPRGGGFF